MTDGFFDFCHSLLSIWVFKAVFVRVVKLTLATRFFLKDRLGLLINQTNSTLSDYMITIFPDRHSGMDSLRAFLPGALRVNANLLQTDLCRNPGSMDGFEPAIPYDYAQDRPWHWIPASRRVWRACVLIWQSRISRAAGLKLRKTRSLF